MLLVDVYFYTYKGVVYPKKSASEDGDGVNGVFSIARLRLLEGREVKVFSTGTEY